MSWLRRSFVEERLRIGHRQSYRLVPATGVLVPSSYIVDMLNCSAVNTDDIVTVIPDDLARPDELAEGQVTERDVKRWCGRKVNPLPHYRLNKNTIRVRRSQFDKWMGGIHEGRA